MYVLSVLYVHLPVQVQVKQCLQNTCLSSDIILVVILAVRPLFGEKQHCQVSSLCSIYLTDCWLIEVSVLRNDSVAFSLSLLSFDIHHFYRSVFWRADPADKSVSDGDTLMWVGVSSSPLFKTLFNHSTPLRSQSRVHTYSSWTEIASSCLFNSCYHEPIIGVSLLYMPVNCIALGLGMLVR